MRHSLVIFAIMKYHLLFLALLAAPFTQADDLNQSLQQNKQQLADISRQNQQRWLNQHTYQKAERAESAGDFSQVCLDYQGLRFTGITLIDPTPFAPRAGECLNAERLNQLSRDLTQAYLTKGYIHNPLQFEDDHSGWLTLHVFEGNIAALNGAEGFNAAQIFPHALGKPLKVQDLDQALDQANRIPGNQVTVDVLPAKNGEIQLDFSNQRSRPFSGRVELDNGASKTYHRWQSRASLNLGNPFGLSDTLYLSGAHTLHSTQQFSRSALLYYSVPYGYWTFNAFVSASQFKTPLKLQQVSLQQRGRTVQSGISADFVFHRGENHISTISTQFEHINSKNRLDDVILELQSPRLNSVSVGLNHLQLFENASLVADFRYEQGQNKGENQPQDRFRRWNVALKWDRYQPLGGQLFRHSHQLTAQYSRDYLPAIKQEDFTGRYRVRGLNDLSLSAEKNAVLHNDMAWIKRTDFGTFAPYIGVDVGLQRAVAPNATTDKAFAYALGLEWERDHLQTRLEWATGRLFTRDNAPFQAHFLYANVAYRF